MEGVVVAEEIALPEGFERVLVELEWWDGPLAGLLEIDGVPCYFRILDSWVASEASVGEFHVWPTTPEVLALERESWASFVRWNEKYEAGEVGSGTHPGIDGVDARFGELDVLLSPGRQPPPDADVLRAEFARVIQPEVPRYSLDGVDYGLRWQPAPPQATTDG